MTQVDAAKITHPPQTPRLYMTLMGYTTQRPADYPTVDRATLMRNAHVIAKRTRALAGYREALSQALKVAWAQANSTCRIASLARQASAGAAIASNRSAHRARSSFAYAS